MGKRNVWKDAEVRYFLTLVKEKKIIGLMDGKRLRTQEIFKTLEKPMLEAGFPRDAASMQVKYKNLKREYYKNCRDNNVSGNSRTEFEFFNEMSDLLGDRPALQMTGIESAENLVEEAIECEVDPTGTLRFMTDLGDVPNGPSSTELFIESSTDFENFSERSSSTLLEDTQFAMEGVAGPSRVLSRNEEVPTPSRARSRAEEQSTPGSTPGSTRKNTYQKSLDKFLAIQSDIKDTFSRIANDMSSDQDHLLLNEMMDRQEKMLERSTSTIVSALMKMSKKGKKKSRAPPSSSSSSDTD